MEFTLNNVTANDVQELSEKLRVLADIVEENSVDIAEGEGTVLPARLLRLLNKRGEL